MPALLLLFISIEPLIILVFSNKVAFSIFDIVLSKLILFLSALTEIDNVIGVTSLFSTLIFIWQVPTAIPFNKPVLETVATLDLDEEYLNFKLDIAGKEVTDICISSPTANTLLLKLEEIDSNCILSALDIFIEIVAFLLFIVEIIKLVEPTAKPVIVLFSLSTAINESSNVYLTEFSVLFCGKIS